MGIERGGGTGGRWRERAGRAGLSALQRADDALAGAVCGAGAGGQRAGLPLAQSAGCRLGHAGLSAAADRRGQFLADSRGAVLVGRGRALSGAAARRAVPGNVVSPPAPAAVMDSLYSSSRLANQSRTAGQALSGRSETSSTRKCSAKSAWVSTTGIP